MIRVLIKFYQIKTSVTFQLSYLNKNTTIRT